jgi:ParB family chromosome partitioning protein
MDKIGAQHGLSKNTVARYLRVNKLIPELKDRLDNDEICMRAAEALSYLRTDEQEMVVQLAGNVKINIKQADILKEKSQNGELDAISIKRIFEPGYFPTKIKPLKLSGQFLSQYFDENQSAEEIDGVIAQALEQYFSSRSNSC